jgi:hypothetical protein
MISKECSVIRSFLPLALVALVALAACGDDAKKSASDHPPPSTRRPASADAANQWKFEVKSGSFEMKATLWPGDVTDTAKPLVSTLLVYFDDYGAKMSSDWVVAPGDTMHTILNDGWVVNYNLKQGTGIRMKAPPQLRNGVPHLLDDLAMEEIRKRPTYKDLGTKQIMGHEATGFSLDSGGTTATVWEWKRIPLYMEGKGKVNTLYEMTKLDADVSVPASRFLPPNGVHIEDLQQGAAAAATPDTNGGPLPAPSEPKKK